ncbi:chemotaxis response regulator protein-glutamate methylesterase [Blastopirellula sp. JC732]|uniref:Protein-glutamate methylesterase/protein-glutamine glutaminase n=1 Tax=Blastopirellula sediminis TaxID=2894196 RepID=A0A9X1SGP0_9BACT|nr:chemotaxis response regulator protein-glutamate methylesterase [Blastopirellula sediminis]MCC9607520.1 chemotaxis response regulator protein-glutamate methylesterase [Blastopirellula sediminis]MCC9629187.1 chemotaxis response regulator protein-glutamate methylesterase [Blastopirellula sediminis]
MSEEDRIRVLVVDDSALYRKLVRDILAQIPQIEVVGVAADGRIALDKIEYLQPDLITLDVEMPTIDGLGVLREMKRFAHQPGVIMLSALTGAGAQATMAALQLGAFDFVLKPAGTSAEQSMSILSETLRQRVDAYLRRVVRTTRPIAVGATHRAASPPPKPVEAPKPPHPTSLVSSHDLTFRSPIEAVAIGISTGGPPALTSQLPNIPQNFPVPIFVVQHMPPLFTKSLAEDLNRRCQVEVVEASDGEDVRPGVIYIAPGGHQMKVERDGVKTRVRVNDDPHERNCRPSVDYLFRSISHVYGGSTLGVIMTGMGDDGTVGCRLLKRLGANIIAQNEESSVVYGMPRSIVEAGLADLICPLNDVGREIVNCVKRSRG